MPFCSTLPAGVRSTLARDRLGKLLYSCVNDANDGRRSRWGELHADWEDGGGEDEINIEVRDGGGLLCKLGSRSGRHEPLGLVPQSRLSQG